METTNTRAATGTREFTSPKKKKNALAQNQYRQRSQGKGTKLVGNWDCQLLYFLTRICSQLSGEGQEEDSDEDNSDFKDDNKRVPNVQKPRKYPRRSTTPVDYGGTKLVGNWDCQLLYFLTRICSQLSGEGQEEDSDEDNSDFEKKKKKKSTVKMKLVVPKTVPKFKSIDQEYIVTKKISYIRTIKDPVVVSFRSDIAPLCGNTACYAYDTIKNRWIIFI